MNEVFYDSWAWIEVYSGTAKGGRIDARYGSGRANIHTSLWALAEVGAKTHAEKGDSTAQSVIMRIQKDAAEVHGVTLEDVRSAVALRTELRARSRKPASLGDAVILSQARRLKLPLISGDPAFDGQKDVRSD